MLTKNRNTSVLTLAILTTTALFTATAQAALVGHWEFDNSGDVGEATVSSNLETVGDAAYSASGKIGGALALDGTGDYLRVDGSDSLASGLTTGAASFTLAAFVQTTTAGRGIIGWGNYGSGGQVNAFRIGDSANTLTHYSWGGGVDYANVSAPGVTDGTWHHVAATYDGTTKRIYLDGVEVGSGLVVGALNVGSANFRIGSTNSGEIFNGLIDDVRVYDTALSESAIGGLANPAPIPTPAALPAGLALLGVIGLRRRR